MITYLGMTMPMAIFALISWLKHPYNGNKVEVKVNQIRQRETIHYCSVVVCFVAFFANDVYGYLNWKQMEKRQV